MRRAVCRSSLLKSRTAVRSISFPSHNGPSRLQAAWSESLFRLSRSSSVVARHEVFGLVPSHHLDAPEWPWNRITRKVLVNVTVTLRKRPLQARNARDLHRCCPNKGPSWRLMLDPDVAAIVLNAIQYLLAHGEFKCAMRSTGSITFRQPGIRRHLSRTFAEDCIRSQKFFRATCRNDRISFRDQTHPGRAPGRPISSAIQRRLPTARVRETTSPGDPQPSPSRPVALYYVCGRRAHITVDVGALTGLPRSAPASTRQHGPARRCRRTVRLLSLSCHLRRQRCQVMLFAATSCILRGADKLRQHADQLLLLVPSALLATISPRTQGRRWRFTVTALGVERTFDVDGTLPRLAKPSGGTSAKFCAPTAAACRFMLRRVARRQRPSYPAQRLVTSISRRLRSVPVSQVTALPVRYRSKVVQDRQLPRSCLDPVIARQWSARSPDATIGGRSVAPLRDTSSGKCGAMWRNADVSWMCGRHTTISVDALGPTSSCAVAAQRFPSWHAKLSGAGGEKAFVVRLRQRRSFPVARTSSAPRMAEYSASILAHS